MVASGLLKKNQTVFLKVVCFLKVANYCSQQQFFFIICNKRSSNKLYHLLMRSPNFTRSKVLKNQFSSRKYKRTSLKYHLSCLIKNRSDLFPTTNLQKKECFFHSHIKYVHFASCFGARPSMLL